MHSIVNCKECGNLFKGHGRPICFECKREEDESVLEIRRYVRKNPSSSASEICDAVNVSVEFLSRMIDEGRIVVKINESPLKCQICDSQIARGKICTTCASKLTDGLDKSKATSKDGQRITTRYFNKNR